MFRQPAGRFLWLPFRSPVTRPKLTHHPLLPPVRRKVTLTETIHIRFQNSVQVRRRVFQAFIYITAFYVFQRVVLGPLEDLDLPEEEVKGSRKKQKTKPTPEEVLNGTDEFEGEDDPFFIPLGWTTEQPRQWYKGSDPEWRDFQKLSQDKQRNQTIRQQLVTVVRTQYAGHPQFKQMCGNINAMQGNYWLELLYPEGPPIEYARTGVEISDDVIAWTSRPVSERNHQRLNRTIYPWATVQSIYTTSAVLMKLNWHNLQAYLGMNPKLDIEVVRLKRLQAAIVAHQRMQHKHGSGTDGVPTSSSTSASMQSSQSSLSKPSAADNSRGIASFLPNPSSLVSAGLPSSLTANVTLCRLLFMHYLMHHRAWSAQPDPPRGSVVLTGLVELVGDKGRLMVEVVAAYDVKSAQFVELMSAPKQFQPHRQAPRGGP